MPMVDRPVWLTAAPVRLLPIRLTVDPLATEVVAVVPATPRRTVTFSVLVGSTESCTYSELPEVLSISCSTSPFIRNELSPRIRPVVVLDDRAVA